MIKYILTFFAIILTYSCVSVRFPKDIKVNISVPENFDLERLEILVDTLKGLNKKGENKINGTVEFLIHSAASQKDSLK